MVRIVPDKPVAALVAYGLLLVLLHLWPFRLTTAIPFFTNDAVWSRQAGGVHFGDHGMLVTPEPPVAVHGALQHGQGLTVEAWLTPATLAQGGPTRIVSYAEHTGSRNFTLGQEGPDLVVRLRTPATDHNAANPQAEVPDVFAARRPAHVAATYDFATLRVYVDGAPRATFDWPEGDFRTWDRGHLLALGNEPSGERPWRGTLARVAVHDRALSSTEVEEAVRLGRPAPGALLDYDLTAGIPDALARPAFYANGSAPEFLSPVGRRPADFALSFVLLGIAGVLAVRATAGRAGSAERAVATALVLAAAGALALEALQFFVEGRTSSFRDLVAGLAGATVGVYAGWRWSRPAPAAGALTASG